MPEKNILELQLTESHVEKGTAISLRNAFTSYFDQAEKLKEEAEKIKVTSGNQKDLMSYARKIRLELKSIRVQVDHRREELKEDGIRKGKAIQGIANVLKFLIIPIEEYLLKQEMFVILQERKRLSELEEKRINEFKKYDLDNYDADNPYTFDLKNMPEDQYQKLLKIYILSFENDKKEKAEAEKQRIEEEKAEAERRQKIFKENEQLKMEALRKDKLIQLGLILNGSHDGQEFSYKDIDFHWIDIKTMSVNEWDTLIVGAQKRMEVILKEEARALQKHEEFLAKKEEEEKIEKAKTDKMLSEEKKKLQAAEEKIKLSQEKEDEQKRLEKHKQDRIREEDRKKQLLPDRGKLFALTIDLNQIIRPYVKSKEAEIIVEEVFERINEVISYIRKTSMELK